MIEAISILPYFLEEFKYAVFSRFGKKEFQPSENHDIPNTQQRMWKKRV